MDLATAHATLGVDVDTPLDEVKRRYRMRAQMLHPDRLGEQPDLQAEAHRAMSDLSEAWETVATADRQGRRAARSESTDPQPAGSTRLPRAGECDLCGCLPARRVKYRALTGLIILWRNRGLDLELCRPCGKGAFRAVQSDTLVTGWWGIFAVYANLVVVVWNVVNLAGHQRGLPQPSFRDPAVASPFPPGLPLAPPVLRRPASILATLVAAAVMFFLIVVAPDGTNAQSDNPPAPAPSPSTTVDPVIGTCLDANGSVADCSGPLAQFRIAKRVYSGSQCDYNETVFSTVSGAVYCAAAVR
jgi:hypothetical protein